MYKYTHRYLYEKKKNEKNEKNRKENEIAVVENYISIYNIPPSSHISYTRMHFNMNLS